MASIHPTAIIDPSAKLAGDVEVGPFTIIEADVEVGPGCRIGSHVTLGRNLRLGAHVIIHPYASVGTRSQDLKHRGERSRVVVEDGVIIREYASINRGTREGGETRVGRGAVIMAYAHVAHECVIGEGAILVNAATLGGEVEVGPHAMVGGLVGVHQFCHIGAYSIIGACSKVAQDIGPFLLCDGHPARPFGPNVVGLRRSGHTPEQIDRIRAIYRDLFSGTTSLDEQLDRLGAGSPDDPLAATIERFCRRATRGLARPRWRWPQQDAETEDPDAIAGLNSPEILKTH